jgi:HK97 family phage prohead protease
MPIRLVPQKEFHRVARAGQARGVAVRQPSAKLLETADTASRVRRWRFSDGGVDRMNDRLNPSGWDTKNFMAAGGPVLFAHDAGSPPIGATRAIWSDSVSLKGDIEFADADTYEFADLVFKLIASDFLRGGSVGFLPLQWEWADDPKRPHGINFLQQELLEFSITPTPALPTALIEARSSAFRIDTRPMQRWCERTLDTGGKVTLSRNELNRLREAAKEPPRTGIAKSRASDLATAAAIRFRLGPVRRANDLARAGAVRRRILGEAAPDYVAMRIAHARQEDARRRDTRAAADRLASMLSW